MFSHSVSGRLRAPIQPNVVAKGQWNINLNQVSLPVQLPSHPRMSSHLTCPTGDVSAYIIRSVFAQSMHASCPWCCSVEFWGSRFRGGCRFLGLSRFGVGHNILRFIVHVRRVVVTIRMVPVPMLFQCALSGFRDYELRITETASKMTKIYPESNLFSIKFPLSIPFDGLTNFTFAALNECGAMSCRASTEPYWISLIPKCESTQRLC